MKLALFLAVALPVLVESRCDNNHLGRCLKGSPAVAVPYCSSILGGWSDVPTVTKFVRRPKTTTITATHSAFTTNFFQSTATEYTTETTTVTAIYAQAPLPRIRAARDFHAANDLVLAARDAAPPKCVTKKRLSPAEITSGCACFHGLAVVTTTVSVITQYETVDLRITDLKTSVTTTTATERTTVYTTLGEPFSYITSSSLKVSSAIPSSSEIVSPSVSLSASPSAVSSVILSSSEYVSPSASPSLPAVSSEISSSSEIAYPSTSAIASLSISQSAPQSSSEIVWSTTVFLVSQLTSSAAASSAVVESSSSAVESSFAPSSAVESSSAPAVASSSYISSTLIAAASSSYPPIPSSTVEISSSQAAEPSTVSSSVIESSSLEIAAISSSYPTVLSSTVEYSSSQAVESSIYPSSAVQTSSVEIGAASSSFSAIPSSTVGETSSQAAESSSLFTWPAVMSTTVFLVAPLSSSTAVPSSTAESSSLPALESSSIVASALETSSIEIAAASSTYAAIPSSTVVESSSPAPESASPSTSAVELSSSEIPAHPSSTIAAATSTMAPPAVTTCGFQGFPANAAPSPINYLYTPYVHHCAAGCVNGCSSYSWNPSDTSCTFYYEPFEAFNPTADANGIFFYSVTCAAAPLPSPLCSYSAASSATDLIGSLTLPYEFNCYTACVHSTPSCLAYSYHASDKSCQLYSKSIATIDPPYTRNPITDYVYNDLACQPPVLPTPICEYTAGNVSPWWGFYQNIYYTPTEYTCWNLCQNDPACVSFSYAQHKQCSLYSGTIAADNPPYDPTSTFLFSDRGCPPPAPLLTTPTCNYKAGNVPPYWGFMVNIYNTPYEHSCWQECQAYGSGCASYSYNAAGQCSLYSQSLALSYPPADPTSEYTFSDRACAAPSWPVGPLCQYTALSSPATAGAKIQTFDNIDSLNGCISKCFIGPTCAALSYDGTAGQCSTFSASVKAMDPVFSATGAAFYDVDCVN